jgi:predicted small lipoprotein YifL
MKKNTKDLLKMGIVVPALVLSLAACGASGTTSTPASEAGEAATEETVVTTEEADAAEAAEPVTYENEGMKMTVPGEFADKVIVTIPESKEDGVLFTVSEKASVDAAVAMGESAEDGYGWLFAIGKLGEEEVNRMLCNDMSGQIVFAQNADGEYYIYYHPTDVRYNRETPEQMEADQEDWSAVCAWADSMRDAFIAENEGLTAKSFDNSTPAIYIARAALEEGANFEISTTEFGPMAPNGVDGVPYFEKLVQNAKYEYVDMEEAPDGEYVVLSFPDDNVRFDFFKADGSKNLIRQVTTTDDEEYSYYFQATLADESVQAADVMQEWYNALVEANK